MRKKKKEYILNILKDLNVEEIQLVGFDGFSTNMRDNFYSEERAYLLTEDFIKRLNESTARSLKGYREKIKITSLTPTKYMED